MGLCCPSCPRQCPALWYPIPDLGGMLELAGRMLQESGAAQRDRGMPRLCWFVQVQAGPQPGLLSERKESGSAAPHEEAERKSQCSRHIMNSSGIRASFSCPKSFLLLRTTARIQRTNEKQITINSHFSFKKTPKSLLCTGTKNRNVKLKPKELFAAFPLKQTTTLKWKWSVFKQTLMCCPQVSEKIGPVYVPFCYGF